MCVTSGSLKNLLIIQESWLCEEDSMLLEEWGHRLWNVGNLWKPKESAYNTGDLGSIPGSGSCFGEGNGNPLQSSCLENSMDREAWRATVHAVTKSQTRLSNTLTLFWKPEEVRKWTERTTADPLMSAERDLCQTLTSRIINFKPLNLGFKQHRFYFYSKNRKLIEHLWPSS